MSSIRALVPLAAAAGLMAAVPAGALAAPSHQASAHAAGVDATALIYPSIVQTRLVRAQAALDKAAKYSDLGMPAKAITSLTAARNNLSKAWKGAKYVIDTTPPPLPAEDKAIFHRRSFFRSGRLKIYKGRRHTRRVHGADVVPPVGAVPASIYDTGFAALSLQHYAATVSVSLIDDTSGTALTAVRSTLSRSVNDRDAAIAYIHSIDVAAPPAEDKVRAHQAAEEEVASWATTMPNATAQLADEIQQVEGTQAETGLTGAQKSILAGADYRDIKTQNNLNLFWPPVPAED
jgi:hypothetical protein